METIGKTKRNQVFRSSDVFGLRLWRLYLQTRNTQLQKAVAAVLTVLLVAAATSSDYSLGMAAWTSPFHGDQVSRCVFGNLTTTPLTKLRKVLLLLSWGSGLLQGSRMYSAPNSPDANIRIGISYINPSAMKPNKVGILAN